jgi:hypothetical protein
VLPIAHLSREPQLHHEKSLLTIVIYHITPST